MPKSLIKSRLFSYRNKMKVRAQIETNQSQLPQNLQSYKQKRLPGNVFLVYKRSLKISN